MNNPLPLESIETERANRLQNREIDGAQVDAMLEQALAPFEALPLVAPARAAYAFAKTIDYDHPGLSAAAYLAHPVRVASLALRVIRPPEQNATVLALLHNIFELSRVTPEEISRHFGAHISEAMRVLTVDRTQKAREYTVRYYRAIRGMPSYVRIIKVLDKLDNLFILGLNPSDEVRRAYLADIEEFVVPMVAADLPHLVPYFASLIEDCHRTGFIGQR